MSFQQTLCSALCDGFQVREVPIGFSITSPFMWLEDEPLVFIGRKEGKKIRFEDSGATLMLLEDVAGDLSTDARLDAIRMLASEHHVTYDEEGHKFYTQWQDIDSSSSGIISFLSFMNRIQDMKLLSRERVENTFRDDLVRAITEHFSSGFSVKERQEVIPGKIGYISDVSVTNPANRTVAVYAATQEVKALEALLASEVVFRENIKTVMPLLVFEDYLSSSISKRTRTRSMNNEVMLLADWSGGKEQVIEKVEKSFKSAA